MKSFLSRFHSLLLFVRSGFDRLRLVGESRLLNHTRGVQSYCHQQRILFRDFPAHAQKLTETLRKQTSDGCGDVPFLYLNSPDIDKEATAFDSRRIKNFRGQRGLWGNTNGVSGFSTGHG